MGKVVVFSTQGCKFCVQAKELLMGLRVDFVEVDLQNYPSMWQTMIEKSGGKKTVPQIFFNSTHIGGFSALKELELRGELEEKIQQALLEPEDPEFQEILAISQPPSSSSSSSSFYPSLSNHNVSSASGNWVVSPELERVYKWIRSPTDALKSVEPLEAEVGEEDDEMDAEVHEDDSVHVVVDSLESQDHPEVPSDQSQEAIPDEPNAFEKEEEEEEKEKEETKEGEVVVEKKDSPTVPKKDEGRNSLIVPKKSVEPVQYEIECTYDQCVRKPRRIISGLPLRTRFFGLWPVQNCFQGLDLIKWFQKELEMPLNDATKTAQQLLDLRFFHVPTKDALITSYPATFNETLFYRFYEDQWKNVLNAQFEWKGETRPAHILALEMRKLLSFIEAKYITASGRQVDYHNISQSHEFEQYKRLAIEMQGVDLDDLAEDPSELMAFFINIYNILMIHGSIQLGAPFNMTERTKFFANVSYLIGGHRFSLNDVEHGILRVNARPPYALFRQFSSGDPRIKYMVPKLDPRIHFVLVCGAKSCPPVRIYSSDNIDRALQMAAEAYCTEEVEIDFLGKKVFLPKIFDWYDGDFGKDATQMLTFISTFIGDKNGRSLLQMIDNKQKPKIVWKEYDWTQNIGASSNQEENFF